MKSIFLVLLPWVTIPFLLGAGAAEGEGVGGGTVDGGGIDGGVADGGGRRPAGSFRPAVAVPGIEPTPTPTLAEWKAATSIEARPLGASQAEDSCAVKQVREWVELRCPFVEYIEQTVGPHQGVKIMLAKAGSDKSADEQRPSTGVAVFPLRRGDRRVISIYTGGGGYKSFGIRLAGVLSEVWVDDTRGPVLAFE